MAPYSSHGRTRRQPVSTLEPRVERGRRLAQPLAPLRMERLAGVERVPGGVVAGQDPGDERAERVGPGREPAGDHDGGRRVVLSHVEVAAAMKLDHPPLARDDVGGELLVVDDL